MRPLLVRLLCMSFRNVNTSDEEKALADIVFFLPIQNFRMVLYLVPKRQTLLRHKNTMSNIVPI